MMSQTIVIMLVLLTLTVNIVTSSYSPSINRMIQFNSLYNYSNIPVPLPPSYTNIEIPSAVQCAFWWTPNAIVDDTMTVPRRNVLSFAVMSFLPGYVGVGFNQISVPTMYGVAVVGVPQSGVALYSIIPGLIQPISYQLNYTSVEVLDGHTTMQFVWDLNVVNGVFDFSIDTLPLTVLYASSSGVDTTAQHNWAYAAQTFGLNNGSNTIPLTNQVCDCSIIQIPNRQNLTHCPCTCPGSALAPTCVNTTLPFSLGLFDDYNLLVTLHWLVIGNYTYFDVQSQAPAGWFALGFANSAEGTMKGTQAVIFTSASVITRNIIAAASSGLIPTGALNVSNIKIWTLENGYPGFSFRVPLAEISSTNVVYLVAVSSPQESLGSTPHKFETHGAYTVNLVTGQALQPSFIWNIKSTHGIIMYLSWALIFPFGYLWARFTKAPHNAMWFEGHRLAMTVGFVLALAGACVAFGMVSTHFSTAWHSQVGMTALVLCLFQICSGILRPHLDVNKRKSFQRSTFEILHHLLGRAGILLAWAAIYGGLEILPNVSPVFLYLHVTVCVLWILLHAFLEIRAQLKRKGYQLLTNSKPASYG